MGSLLLAAGEKDMRFALPNARIMVHQPSGGYQGQVTDILIHAREVESLKKRLNEIYVKHTGRDIKAIEEALERDNFLDGRDGARNSGSSTRSSKSARMLSRFQIVANLRFTGEIAGTAIRAAGTAV